MTTGQVKDYENYTVTSLDYDKCRVPVGVEVILGALSLSSERALKELHILDAGCGTGNYIVALNKHVGKVTGLELNGGMLSQSREKTAAMTNVELHQGSVLEMPFSDGEFDGVICNLVLHHLDPEDATDFPNVTRFMSETFRVLKPKGVLVINTTFPEQLENGSMWFLTLIPEALKRAVKRSPSRALLQGAMLKVGFTLGPAVSLTRETHMSADVWLDKEGPLKPAWRNAISYWALATPEQVQSALDKWRKLLDEGKADEYIAKYEGIRKEIGITTSVIAYRQHFFDGFH